jgi:hypothetical protein
MRSFSTYAGKGGAKEFAEALVVELAKGSPIPLLTAKQAQNAFNIRDMLNCLPGRNWPACSGIGSGFNFYCRLKAAADQRFIDRSGARFCRDTWERQAQADCRSR